MNKLINEEAGREGRPSLFEKGVKHASHLPALTGLRGLAAVYVFIVHIELPKTFISKYAILENYKELGWVGVPLFFVLSGYLITWLGLREINVTGAFRLFRFYIRRIIRIWPLYFTACAVGLWAWHRNSLIPRELGADPSWTWPLLTFTTNFAIRARENAEGMGALLPLWTIAVEEQFYMVWGILLRWLPRRILIRLVSVLIGLSWVFRLGLTPIPFLFYRMHSGVAMGSLMTGCLLALTEEQVRQRIPSRSALVVIASMGFLEIGLLGWPFPVDRLPSFALLTVVDILSACLILAAASGEGMAVRFLALRPVIYVGEVSYCIYIFHFGFLMWFYRERIQYSMYLPDPMSWPLWSVIVDGLIAGCVVLAVRGLWTVAESPVQRLRSLFR
jgi:peptidoglycan/LPS O-acetylase OafA/YrhL